MRQPRCSAVSASSSSGTSHTVFPQNAYAKSRRAQHILAQKAAEIVVDFQKQCSLNALIGKKTIGYAYYQHSLFIL
ncbi:MAG: hypothetical protein IPM53_29570 [Anaerolineaceae bacterium]|nr:hypothetical protein [Anaerolineaceae bacterium]